MDKLKKDYTQEESYSKSEYDELILEIGHLKQELEYAYNRCHQICLDASRSNWSVKNTKNMAIHCARLIEHEKYLREFNGHQNRSRLPLEKSRLYG